ncbi:tyrosine-type recombinase/integrase [Thermodesulfobacteriota bacterium]
MRHPGFTWHDLRRTSGTRLYWATGTNILAVQRFLGHSNPQTTLRYLCRSQNDVRDGVNAVDLALPGSDPTSTPTLNPARHSAPPDAHPNYRHLKIADKSAR